MPRLHGRAVPCHCPPRAVWPAAPRPCLSMPRPVKRGLPRRAKPRRADRRPAGPGRSWTCLPAPHRPRQTRSLPVVPSRALPRATTPAFPRPAIGSPAERSRACPSAPFENEPHRAPACRTPPAAPRAAMPNAVPPRLALACLPCLTKPILCWPRRPCLPRHVRPILCWPPWPCLPHLAKPSRTLPCHATPAGPCLAATSDETRRLCCQAPRRLAPPVHAAPDHAERLRACRTVPRPTPAGLATARQVHPRRAMRLLPDLALPCEGLPSPASSCLPCPANRVTANRRDAKARLPCLGPVTPRAARSRRVLPRLRILAAPSVAKPRPAPRRLPRRAVRFGAVARHATACPACPAGGCLAIPNRAAPLLALPAAPDAGRAPT